MNLKKDLPFWEGGRGDGREKACSRQVSCLYAREVRKTKLQELWKKKEIDSLIIHSKNRWEQPEEKAGGDFSLLLSNFASIWPSHSRIKMPVVWGSKRIFFFLQPILMRELARVSRIWDTCWIGSGNFRTRHFPSSKISENCFNCFGGFLIDGKKRSFSRISDMKAWSQSILMMLIWSLPPIEDKLLCSMASVRRSFFHFQQLNPKRFCTNWNRNFYPIVYEKPFDSNPNDFVRRAGILSFLSRLHSTN